MNDRDLKGLLSGAKTIAVVGCSRDPSKSAHTVPRYLQSNGHRVVPVNPFAVGERILGEKVFASLAEVQGAGLKVDIVDVFRPSDEALKVVAEAMKLDPKPKLVWLQLGIQSPEAERLARGAGVPIVMNSCLKVEHSRFFG